MKENNPVVYSTEKGRICPDCGFPEKECRCRTKKTSKKLFDDSIVRIRKEKRGRNGKEVTSIQGIPLSEQAIQSIASDIKKKLGTGGTIKDGIIEIQGDRVEFIAEYFIKLGYKVQKNGG
jgi:translation initiation factor 1